MTCRIRPRIQPSPVPASSLVVLSLLLGLLAGPVALSAGADGPPKPLHPELPAGLNALPGLSLSMPFTPATPAPGTAAAACADGIVYDDGTVEGGLAFEADSLDLVMAFDVGSVDRLLEQVCICWTRDEGPQTDIDYEIVVYEEGPDGLPGDVIDVISDTATNVPVFPASTLYDVDLSEFDIRNTTERVFIGAFWFPQDTDNFFFLCTDDDDPGSGPQPILVSGDLGASWFEVRDLEPAEGDPADAFSRIDALIVRATFEEEDAPQREPFVCTEDDTTLCLTDERFEVKVQWTAQGDTGPGMRGPDLTTDTGWFWFFDDANVELVVKVLDACALPEEFGGNDFWVFAGGLTDVEVEITITDSFTGDTAVYRNQAGNPFQPVQDTEAFNTCDATR